MLNDCLSVLVDDQDIVNISEVSDNVVFLSGCRRLWYVPGIANIIQRRLMRWGHPLLTWFFEGSRIY